MMKSFRSFYLQFSPLEQLVTDTRTKFLHLSLHLTPFRCLTKKYPKDLPTISVVLFYINEALSVIKRAIRSIITNTPKHLLKEIILVDDHSTYSEFNCKCLSVHIYIKHFC